ncbi:hypothetical protein [Gloeocapsopsis sp. IPPAS B-1203]|nr:hypothetical protein [Gloeocapsopsis sp. IPPAS B-1203]
MHLCISLGTALQLFAIADLASVMLLLAFSQFGSIAIATIEDTYR